VHRLSFILWPFRKMFSAIRWSLLKLVAAIIWVLLIPWRILKVIARIPRLLFRGAIALPGAVWRFTMALPRTLWRGFLAIPRFIWRGIRTLVRWVLTPPRWVWRQFCIVVLAVIRSPRKAYQSLKSARDWLLGKVEYLQSESQKWKTTFNILKSPYSLLRAMGLNPQMAATLLIGTTAVGSGVVVNETLLAERSFSRGDAGVYLAPGDAPVSYVTNPEEPGFNTLRIDLGSTAVREITIENVSVGTVFTGSALPSGVQNVVEVGGTASASTRLEVGHFTFEKSRCKKLELSDLQIHTLVIRGNASDGQSVAPSAGTSRMRAIGGGHHQADAMLHSGGTFDRIWISAPASGVNGKVDKLTLTNLYTKGGPCVLSRMNIGTMEILLNEIGAGDGFATKEFTVATNVTAANITVEDNVEVTITEPATQ
jgi:hypothetical protein